MTSHRKASVSARKRTLQRAVGSMVERLEERFLLATMRYRFPGADENEWAEINYSDDVDATFIFMGLDEDAQAPVQDALTNDPTVPPPADPEAEAPVVGFHLYAIYVHAATINSYMSVTYRRAEPGGIVTEPFGEGVGNFWVTNAQNGNGYEVNMPDGTGRLILGGVSLDDSPVLYPMFEATTGAIDGVQPPLTVDGKKYFRPGLYVDDGVDFGRFLFGGTVTGQVRIGGSMELFAAGALLTGISSGAPANAGPEGDPDNFFVNGDLRDLYINGSIGTDTADALHGLPYVTQFDFRASGRVGQIRTNNSFVGSVSVMDPDTGKLVFQTDPTSLTKIQTEVETRGVAADRLFLTQGRLGYGNFFNDSFDTAQYVGTINSADLGLDDSILIEGVLNAVDANNYRDWFDYYAVGLNAGQTVEVQLTDLLTPDNARIRVGVFDPDGRLIATDYSDVDPWEIAGKPFRFTADRPGVYRFAVASQGDEEFVTHETFSAGVTPYQLRIAQITSVAGDGNITLGGVVATNHIYDPNSLGIGFNVKQGDLGAILAGGNVFSAGAMMYMIDPDDPTIVTVESVSVQVLHGDLRAVQGGSVGVRTPNGIGLGIDVYVPEGSVGLVRATSDMLVLNDDYLYIPYLGEQAEITFVRDDYQLVDAATTFSGTIVADRKLGILRAGDMATLSPSIITVNADLEGEDGVIDLIDVVGDLGSIQGGGPLISTGPSGNVRYMNVGGEVYSDYMFGGGAPQRTIFEPGETAIFNDDSGSLITLTPIGGGQLIVTTYGIRGSGGVAVVRVDSSSSLVVQGSALGAAMMGEIGRIDISGTGTSGLAPSVNIGGTARVDVFEIIGGDLYSIANTTIGELVNITANSVYTIQAETIGLAKSSTPTAVNSATIRSDVYPFSQQRILVNIAGAVDLISSRGAMGNISAGSIRSIVVDSDKTHLNSPAGTYESLLRDGITGPIYSASTIADIDIGAGMISAGNGHPARAGIFATGRINQVRGNLADIHGIVASADSIGTIQLVGGSLIGANIFVGELVDVREISDNWSMSHSGGGTINRPVFEIGMISIEGGGSTSTPGNPTPTEPSNGSSNKKYRWYDRKKKKKAAAPKKAAKAPAPPANLPGGIIGTVIGAADIGTVRVNGGFGIINSSMSTIGNGVVDRVEAGGYGLRDVTINGGAKVNNIVALGDGRLAPITGFSSAVRESETMAWDPFTGFNPNGLGDLYSFLNRGDMGLSKDKPSLEGVTNTGVASNMSAVASRELGLLQAWRLQENGMGYYSGSDLMGFNFANTIRKVDIANDVVGTVSEVNGRKYAIPVRFVTGNMPSVTIGRDATALNMTVAGPIGTFSVGRNVDETTKIHAIGRTGTIAAIKINGNFAGLIKAEYRIDSIAIKGQWTGKVFEKGVLVLRNR